MSQRRFSDEDLHSLTVAVNEKIDRLSNRPQSFEILEPDAARDELARLFHARDGLLRMRGIAGGIAAGKKRGRKAAKAQERVEEPQP